MDRGKDPLLLPFNKKMKFSSKDFFSKCDQICSFLWVWSHLRKKCLTENFIFLCSVPYTYNPRSSTVGLLLHLQYYQKCESMILICSYNICIIYLHVIEVCLKVTMFYFCQSKNPSSIMKNFFNPIPFIFFWKKLPLLINIKNKCH